MLCVVDNDYRPHVTIDDAQHLITIAEKNIDIINK